MNGSDPASGDELTDEQLDALLGSAEQELLRHIQDNTDLTATLTRVLTSPLNAEADADARGRADAATSVIALVARAAAGDQAAWDEIVERYAPLVWKIGVRYRLSAEDIGDVAQKVWLLLVEKIGSLREPAALPGWLAKTTQHECLHILWEARRHDRAELPPEDQMPTHPDTAMIEEEILVAEVNAARRAALVELPPICQELLAMLTSDARLSDTEIGQKLGIPTQFVGPLRARLLYRLSLLRAARAVLVTESAPTISCRDVPH